MKFALFRPSLFLLFSMCLYFVRSAPIVGNKTVDPATNQEHSLKQEETSKSSRTVIQEGNDKDILNDETNNEDIVNEETNNEDILNEETSNSEDILNEETNNRKEILNQETNNNDTILNGDESVTLDPIPEKSSEDVKSSFENKTINENYGTLKSKDNERGQRNEDLSTEMHTHEQSNEIEDEDFFFHMLNYIMNGENATDEGKPSTGNGLSKKETDENKQSKMEEDKEGNEDIDVINSEVTDVIKHSKIEEEIESVRKDIKSTVRGGGEENGKTNDTDSS